MPPYRIATLNPEQLTEIERLEEELGVTLIAWEPNRQTQPGESPSWDEGKQSVIDALNSTYQVGEFGDGYLFDH